MEIEVTEDLLKTFPPAAQAIIRALQAELAKLRAEMAELKAKLQQTPQNSSRPPSTQHPHAKLANKKPKSKRKRGGQQGHVKYDRPLIPTKQCDHVETCLPSTCRRCGESLSGKDPEPLRHQVFELPEIKPIVTEYQRHRLTCACCGETTCGPLPLGAPTGQSGPRLVAFIGMAMACFRQSKRRAALFAEMVLGQPCCPALTVKMQNQVAAAVRPAYDELAELLPKQQRLSIDESPTKEAKSKAWLWTMVAAGFTIFAVRLTKGAVVLDELLTNVFKGVVNCDRAKIYWQCGKLQWCWAHLKRDFQALADHPDGRVRRLGQDLMRQTRKLFAAWANYRDGTIAWPEFQHAMQPVKREVNDLLIRGGRLGVRKADGMRRELIKHRDWLWTFLEHQDVEPTNNVSERALRHGVIWRKLSFGTQSNAGSRFVETMLTVIETCRQQDRPLFQYLTDAVDAHFAGRPCPSLLPKA